jgi:L-alanine-DL-glutamate epimerase-like enolase superfamily enzyme
VVVQYAPYGSCANICRAAGGEVNLSGKLGESRVRNAAASSVATAVDSVIWGLSLTNKYLVDDIVRKPGALQHGWIQPIDQPGLGVMIDEAKSAVLKFTRHCQTGHVTSTKVQRDQMAQSRTITIFL